MNALGVQSQHRTVPLDPAAIFDARHDAHARLDLPASAYEVFLAGPSAAATSKR